MSVLVLDSAAFSTLARPATARAGVRAALRGAWAAGAEVLIPAAVLAEQYRGGRHDQVADSYLGRETGVEIVPTTRALARQIGHLLARAGRGSRDHVDATVVAVALAGGGGVIATGDPAELSALADGLVGVTVLSV
jgi:predicted nucleic acid-binding protein